MSGQTSSGQFKMPEPLSPPFEPAVQLQFYVHVIESPGPPDLLDGRTEGRILTDALLLAGIRCSYLLAVNAYTFGEALRRLASMDIASLALIPVIHLSCHGDETGIQLTSAETFKWNDLVEAFRGINRSVGGLLLLCMSSCGGFGAAQMARGMGDLPYFAVVGHRTSARWEDCAVGFVTFYHLLSKGKTIQQAVNGMGVASDDSGFQMAFAQDTQRQWQERVMRFLEVVLQRRRTSSGSDRTSEPEPQQ